MDRYEEALERAKEWEREHPNGYVIRDMMEHIFPGYNESEDERTRKELIHFILYKAGQLLDEETEHKFVAYLERQKEQKPYEPKNWPIDKDNLTQEQKPAEWSEEDGLARDFLLKQTEQYIKVLESIKTEKYIGAKGLIDVASELSDWQSARSFILSLQPHWKPSEEQMGALKLAYEDAFECPEGCVPHLPLKSLYEQLKKL